MTLKNHKTEPNKLNFNPFVGVGPRSFLDLFSISQGYGSEIIRKDKGKVIEWKPENAVLRLQSNIYSLSEIEKDIQKKLKELEEK